MQRFWKVLADHEEPSCGAGAEWGRDGGQALSPEKSISWTTYQWGPNSLEVGGREESM